MEAQVMASSSKGTELIHALLHSWIERSDVRERTYRRVRMATHDVCVGDDCKARLVIEAIVWPP